MEGSNVLTITLRFITCNGICYTLRMSGVQGKSCIRTVLTNNDAHKRMVGKFDGNEAGSFRDECYYGIMGRFAVGDKMRPHTEVTFHKVLQLF